MTPLIVKELADSYRIIEGHHRLRAAKELGLTEVPVQYLQKNLSAKAERELAVKANLLRRQISNKDKEKLLFQYYLNIEYNTGELSETVIIKKKSNGTLKSIEKINTRDSKGTVYGKIVTGFYKTREARVVRFENVVYKSGKTVSLIKKFYSLDGENYLTKTGTIVEPIKLRVA